jgi:hypothetical protein
MSHFTRGCDRQKKEREAKRQSVLTRYRERKIDGNAKQCAVGVVVKVKKNKSPTVVERDVKGFMMANRICSQISDLSGRW